MSSRSSGPGRNPAAIALCGLLLAAAVAVFFAATAQAADYKMLLCAGNNGSNSIETATNTASAQNPGGIFSIENYCGPAPDPAGNSAFLRIVENQPNGNAGNTAYGQISWTAPPWIAILGGGGYTREPESFNDGWRGRFWAEDFGGGGPHNILMQGTGAPNSGIEWGPTSTFSPHLWPFPGYGSYRRFIFELTCMRPAGCDRSGFNAVDANSILLTLADTSPSQVNLTNTDAPFLGGRWVRGTQSVTFNWSELGSGIRFERVLVDNAEPWRVDHLATGECNVGSSQVNGEFARVFQPCATATNIGRNYTFDTAALADGPHDVSACTQDYAQRQGLNGTGSESCDRRTVRTDNTPPGTPLALQVTSSNPARYLGQFGAKFALPPDLGSPIVRAHYDVVDAAGNVVAPERVAIGTNPTEIPKVTGPTQAGEYRLRVWFEDEVGFAGPAAVAPIPRDTTPPAAPQGLSVANPQTSRSTDGFDVRWRNLTDTGSPINAAHYQVLDPNGKVIVPTHDLGGEGIQAIADLDTPKERGVSTLRLWLSDAEGNVGAPVSAPLTYDCARSTAGGGTDLSAGLGEGAERTVVVQEGQGSTMRGKLQGPSGQVGDAAVCIFSTVVSDRDRQFLGVAMTSAAGDYNFSIGAGPSRDLTAVYRPGQRELTASATLRTKVRPSFGVRRKVIHNKGVAVFVGSIPGPHNENVVVILQVKDGKHWRVFRRYQTREGGGYVMRYRFTQTRTPTKFRMRAELPTQSGYPYEGGVSRTLPLRVLP